MSEMSALEHLKTAKRLHFQGLTDDAIREYESVLEIDPDNSDAIAGLRSLGIEPILREDFSDGAVGHAGGLKTNFFTNQAGGDKAGGVKTKVFNLIIACLGIGTCAGLYFLVTYILNYDNITALENVEVHFEKAQMKDTKAYVDVEVINLNPAPVKHMSISFRIADPTDRILREGLVELKHGMVPAGDRRTFKEVELGEINGIPAKLTPHLESLVYGPKPKIKEQFVGLFKEAAAIRDKDALGTYEELVDKTEDFAPAWVGLGRAYAAKGKFDEAMKAYDKAMEIDAMNANAHYYKAVALFYLGQKEEGKKEIDAAYLIAPDDPEIAWNRKYMYTLKGSVPGGKEVAKEDEKAKGDEKVKAGEKAKADEKAASGKKKKK